MTFAVGFLFVLYYFFSLLSFYFNLNILFLFSCCIYHINTESSNYYLFCTLPLLGLHVSKTIQLAWTKYFYALPHVSDTCVVCTFSNGLLLMPCVFTKKYTFRLRCHCFYRLLPFDWTNTFLAFSSLIPVHFLRKQILTECFFFVCFGKINT